MAGVRASRGKTKTRVRKASAKRPAKRKTAKRKAPAKRKTAKRALKRKTTKRKAPAKRKTPKRKTPTKRKTAKRPAKRPPKRKTSKRLGSAMKKVVSAAKRHSKRKRTKSQVERLLFNELESLAQYIHTAKEEIAQIRPDEVKDEFLPKAATELDAIVEATAEATHSIMDACEGLEGAMSKVDDEVSTILMDCTTKIYEACTFQDITGQRISKVISTLLTIEARIDKLIDVLEIKTDKSKAATEQPKDQGEKGVSDGDLLEGPQLKGHGTSQAEIDDLLASFD